ncbi:MAG: cytochrome c oxidase subunit 3 [Hyphomicrobiaceae bacterium]
MTEVTTLTEVPLPTGGEGSRSVGWWGVLSLVASEAALFSYLLFSYFFVAINADTQWPPTGAPELGLVSVNTVILLSTSGTLWLAERQLSGGYRRSSIALQGLTIALGALFAGLQTVEWSNKDFSLSSHTYGSLFFTITGIHLAHVVVGLLVLCFLMLWTILGYFDADHRRPLSIGSIYWHFVDVVWIFIFSSLYLSPHLGGLHGP